MSRDRRGGHLNQDEGVPLTHVLDQMWVRLRGGIEWGVLCEYGASVRRAVHKINVCLQRAA
jgi:hypothetical protein